MRQRRGNGDVHLPLVNSWTVDLFNKLEEERLGTKSAEAIQKKADASQKTVEVIICLTHVNVHMLVHIAG